ncbi:hypothetical protein GLOTRDRAFT_137651 [Gloeophyllum trabeum ATCC 11539]|uniref:Transcription activator of gluconeogenesis ERT1 n=1 Tax=Gloeophyllum trabeum (strain ATCC 11539 / FP-39264 / Madison 617) TaxID=670483 RepID=S7RVK7_GLOTA|nr:uncharacterized protein GLOTRDRAFT_137651 [Gloeophyllum trabeum ATCC 11539]EPQ57294.1 hypothetical protein GLOTRDRAFT_137651 [Gloeophyllum trabeum ATCC 11539]
MSVTAISTAELTGGPIAGGPSQQPSTLGTASFAAGPSQPNFRDSEERSSSANPSKKKSGSCNGRRKRTETPDDGGTPSLSSASRSRDGPKKKKANRACLLCQKAHLTCDDSRPCQRCVRRGMAANCTEGIRKKAKYLLEDDELEAVKRRKSTPPPAPPKEAEPAPLTTSEPFLANDPMFDLTFNPNYSFVSEAANLEYSILSQILGSSPESDTSPPFSSASWPNEPLTPTFTADSPTQYTTSTSLGGPADDYISSTSTYVDSPLAITPAETTLKPDSSLPPNYMTLTYPTAGQVSEEQPSQTAQNAYPLQSFERTPSLQEYQSRFTLQERSSSTPTVSDSIYAGTSKDTEDSHISPPISVDSPSTDTSRSDTPAALGRPRKDDVYKTVTAPYDYTEGYHFLMKHLPTRFEKNDVLRIVRALAIIRPSLIALQMPLSEEDEVFVEKSFQRSLVELEKLISFNGTPTVVWRRTGEICLAGSEFCMLTEWDREELVRGKKYIYELFENQSVVEYWENFASHAFENTTQSVYSHCVLLKPSGAPVPCTFCFSIRRDIFDLPSMVIGQWLPLL